MNTMLEQENEEIQTGIDFKNAMYSIQTGPDATSLPGRIKLLSSKIHCKSGIIQGTAPIIRGQRLLEVFDTYQHS
jgi:hypothetical protein